MQSLSPPRPISPDRSFPSVPKPSISTKTHLHNLNLLLQKTNTINPALQPPKPQLAANSRSYNFNNILNLSNFFNTPKSDEMSPRSLTNLTRLLSDSPRPSPRSTIAPVWRTLHGSADWADLLDPLDPDLRRELIRYGDLVQSAYHAFHSHPSLPPSSTSRPVSLPDRNYRLVSHLFATSSLTLPRWVPGSDHNSSWIGFVAVLDSDREIARIGRRDIVISLRGTSTCHEWAENFRADLVDVDDNASKCKVERGFWSLFKTPGKHVQSLCTEVVNQVKKLMEQYEGEELSITVTGHSLGAALSVLVADELSLLRRVPPIAVFSFGGPRVGNRKFAERVERRGVKVLRVVNAHDLITRVPTVPHVIEGVDCYTHVGRELKVDSKCSPYLRPNADVACCHDLEAYLHLVDGFMGSNRPFRFDAKRSLVKLVNNQGSNLKQKYASKIKDLVLDPVRSNLVQGCLASPS